MNPTLIQYGSLALAIIFEIIGTSFLKQTEQFTRLMPTVCSLLAYAVAFFMLSITLKTLPMGLVYAIWSGAGIAGISVIGWVFFKQALDTPAIIGLAMIMGGVIIFNLFSKTGVH